MLMIFSYILISFHAFKQKTLWILLWKLSTKTKQPSILHQTWRAEFIPSWPNLTEIENFSSSINSFSNSAVQSRNPSQPMQGFGIIL